MLSVPEILAAIASVRGRPLVPTAGETAVLELAADATHVRVGASPEDVAVAGARFAIALAGLRLGADTGPVIAACWRRLLAAVGVPEPSNLQALEQALRVFDDGGTPQTDPVEVGRVFLGTIRWRGRFSPAHVELLRQAGRQ